MKGKGSSKVLKELIEHLMLCLDDLTSMENVSQFAKGEIIAYVECLEAVSSWTKYHKFGIENIEQHYQID